MNPPDNYRKKMFMGANNYQSYQNFDRFGYQYQYTRNVLQLNQGPRAGQEDSIGAPAFSDISLSSNCASYNFAVVTTAGNAIMCIGPSNPNCFAIKPACPRVIYWNAVSIVSVYPALFCLSMATSR